MFYALRSAGISRRRQLFGILRSSFSRHISLASALRCSTLFVQPTYLAGVGFSAFFVLRSADISRRCRLFGIFRFLFSRHISPASALRYLPPFVQPAYRSGVGFSAFFALLSADIPQQRRLFGIFRFLFSRHISPASAFRHSSFFVRPTYRSGVGSSVFSDFRHWRSTYPYQEVSSVCLAILIYSYSALILFSAIV